MRLLCAGTRRESGHSLVVVIFHKLLEFFDVAHGLQVLLHVGQGCEVICKRWTKPETSVFPHLQVPHENVGIADLGTRCSLGIGTYIQSFQSC